LYQKENKREKLIVENVYHSHTYTIHTMITRIFSCPPTSYITRIIWFYTFVFAFLGLQPSSTFSQDSLLLRLEIEDDQTEKLSVLRQVIGANFYNNTDLADSCANIYLQISKSMSNDSIYGSAIIAKSTIKLVKTEYDSVFHYSQLALEKIDIKSYPLLRAKLLHVNALTHYYMGNYERSLEQNFESLKIREAESRPELEIKSLSNIAIVYERLKDYDNAILYNDKALSLCSDDDLYSIATFNNNTANILIIQERHHAAIEKLISANNSAIALNNKLLIVDTHTGLANAYLSLDNYSEAFSNAEKALSSSRLIDNKVKQISSLNIAGNINIKSGDYNKAILYLKEALQISIDNQIKETRINVYTNLSKAYQGLNDYRTSSRMKDSIIMMNSKVYQEEKIKIKEELNIKYETIKKDVLIKENQFYIEKQKNQNNLLKISAAFLLLIAATIFAYMTNRMKYNKKISSQKSELKTQRIEQLEQENKILAMSSMIEGQESERKRIAQDLHDGLGGLLATIKVKFGIIQKEIEELESMNVYKQTSNMIDDACAEVRKIAHNMMPDALSKLGIVSAIKDIADYTTDISIQVMDLGLGKLSETQEIMLYRVIQEFITNTRKHAEASQIIIQFSTDDQHTIIDLEDDGKGYNIKESQDKGLGLKSMESRINFINGHIEMDSKVGIGTTLHIQIPTENTSSIHTQ